MTRRSVVKGMIVVALTAMQMVFFGESFGQPRPRQHPSPRVVVRHPLPPFGKVTPRLPVGGLRVLVGSVAFFFHNGVFYRPQRGRYVVVQAPVGAVVPAIPAGFVTFVSGGMTYYFYGGVYYRAVPSGYVVVEPPPDPVIIVYESPEKAEPEQPMEATETPETRVSVTSHKLNVRSGPGRDHPVIEQVVQGSVLIIKGTAPGWYYVQLPNGKYGWVDKTYTSPYSSPASG